MRLSYSDLCGHAWPNTDAPRYRGAHLCKRLKDHDDEHVCSCGARLDNLDDLAEVPD